VEMAVSGQAGCSLFPPLSCLTWGPGAAKVRTHATVIVPTDIGGSHGVGAASCDLIIWCR